MKRAISLIESIIRTRSTLSQHHFHSISPLSTIISRSHKLNQTPISAPFTTDKRPKPQITKQGPSTSSEDLIHRDRPVARDPITPNTPQTRDKLRKVLGLGSTVPLGLGIYWYLNKLGSTKNIGKEIGMNYIGSKQEFKQEEEVLHKLVEAMPFSTNIYELSHYSFYLGLFLAFTYFKKQPAHFGPSLAFFFILFSFVGLLFSNISSNLANYSALNAKAAFFYQISGTWSNHEGSILLWCLILSFYGFLFCLPRSPR